MVNKTNSPNIKRLCLHSVCLTLSNIYYNTSSQDFFKPHVVLRTITLQNFLGYKQITFSEYIYIYISLYIIIIQSFSLSAF